jgi:hypothetical protein
MADWLVEFHSEFDVEMQELPIAVQDEILVLANLLASRGPRLGRPQSDTLNGSKFANMKELRFNAADGVWRVAYAFDSRRRAILLVAGDKAGSGSRRFYQKLIRKADQRFDAHLKSIAVQGGNMS